MVPMAAHPLVMVEVIPLIASETDASEREKCNPTFGNCDPTISTHMAKLQLLKMSRQCMFSVGWSGTGSSKAEYRRENGGEGHGQLHTIQPRGLLLKPHIHRYKKCSSCRERVQPDIAADIRNGDIQEQESSENFDKAIISGDLVFLGKDAGRNAKCMQSKCNSSIPSIYLQSDDPLDERGIPCYLRGYIFANNHSLLPNGRCYCKVAHHICTITAGTVVQVCAPLDIRTFREIPVTGLIEMEPVGESLHSVLSGKPHVVQDISRGLKYHPLTEVTERENSGATNKPMYSILSCCNKETIESLSLRMSALLANNIWIGTTPRAVSKENARHQELQNMEDELAECLNVPSNEGTSNDYGTNCRCNNPNMDQPINPRQNVNPVPILLREGALLVHNSHPNSGKTALVATIAKDILKCNAVHVLSAPVLFGKYGTSADAALETTLHELALRCAVKGAAAVSMTCVGDRANNDKEQHHPRKVAKLCIILDHLETFLPLSRQVSGDPYFPVLNAMVAYLNRLAFSLKARNEFPFPSNSPLYNLCDSSAAGFTLPLGICLIGVATCLEGNRKGSTFQRSLDAMGGGRFRFPLPSAMTRLSAFQHSFDACGVELTNQAKKILPQLAAKVTWASGGKFFDIAMKLKSEMKDAGASMASELDLQRAMIREHERSYSKTTSYPANSPSQITTSGPAKAVTFSSVGGNMEAKLALEDALALDPAKRHLLSKFGLQTPTGVLMYGPPGTGKTLLARAVSQSLYKKDGVQVENTVGTFVSLKASDIVRPEVGNSEKMIVSAFETARLNAPSVIFIDEFQVRCKDFSKLFLDVHTNIYRIY